MALIGLMDELWWERDRSSASILPLLDLPVAFDHGILLCQLWELGVGSIVLCWFSSFFWGWFQSVLIEKEIYSKVPTLWSASGLCSLSTYMRLLGEVIHRLEWHIITMQTTPSFISLPRPLECPMDVLLHCVEAVRDWMGKTGSDWTLPWFWVFALSKTRLYHLWFWMRLHWFWMGLQCPKQT